MSRKITVEVCNAFVNGYKKSIGNSCTDGDKLFLHGNTIACKKDNHIMITSAGWETKTTKERLNGLPNVRISQKNFQWYLNGQKWDGNWTIVK